MPSLRTAFSAAGPSAAAAADLITDRLALRPWTLGEATAVLGGARPPHWAEDFPAEGDCAVVGLFAEHPAWLGEYGHRRIVERRTGLVVGSIGLFWPPGDGALEIGYGMVPSRRGRGYAPEATRALTEFALTAPGVHTVYADVELSNPSSVRVLEKAGFRCWDTGTARADGTAGAEVPGEVTADEATVAGEGTVRFRFTAPGPARP